MTTRLKLLLSFIVIAISYVVFIQVFKQNAIGTLISISSFLIFAGVYSFILITKFIRQNRKLKPFWILILVGLFINISSNILWFSSLFITKSFGYFNISYLMWICSYFIFLFALNKLTKIISHTNLYSRYFFNLAIFIISATSISIYYLIQPILEVSNRDNLVASISVVYPIIDLGILFLIIHLYYISKYTQLEILGKIIVLSFILQITGDSFFAYQIFKHTYTSGVFSSFLWIIALLFLGFSSMFVGKDIDITKKEPNENSNFQMYFPYVSMFILLILLLHSYQWSFNALSSGFCIIFFMIIIRFTYINRKNAKYLEEYSNLAFYDQLTGLLNRESFFRDLKVSVK